MKRSKMSLSHYKLLTCDMGLLVPLTWYEALPGDTIQHSTSALIRVAPLLSPVMHPVRVRIHHWFVPNRLIWDDWEDFITGGPDGMDQTEWPYMTRGTIQGGQLQDYLGVPTGTYDPAIRFSALPIRAYNLIYNEFYRDQDLVEPLEISKGNGLDSTTEQSVQNCAWEKDYFTAARPWEQKGPGVTIDIGTTAPVIPTGDGAPTFDIAGAEDMNLFGDSVTTDVNWPQANTSDEAAQWNDPKLQANLAAATGINVNDLRLGLAIQRYQEARAQYGSRYVEYLRYLGIRSSDARLQNPEYIGGGRQIIQFSEVLQTAPDDTGADPSVVGEMKGHGISALRTNRYRRFFEEHGIVMSIMSVVPKTIYMDALHRGFSRQTKEEYFQKELQFIGDQAVYNKEVQAEHTLPDDIFGYQSRYDEYRTMPSTVAGEMRDVLNHWHYGRDFSGDIALNESFIECVPTKRVNAAQENHVLYVMANHSVQARRMMQRIASSRTF